MSHLRFGSYKITAAKVSQKLSSLEAYQCLTESPNVGSFGKTKRKFVEMSDMPLIKRKKKKRHSWNFPLTTGKSLASWNSMELILLVTSTISLQSSQKWILPSGPPPNW